MSGAQAYHQAYYKVATVSMSPRELEASLLLKAAGRLQAVQQGWAGEGQGKSEGQGENEGQGTGEGEGKSEGKGHPADLFGALDYNRRLWTILLSAIADPENPISPEIRQNVTSIGIFILHRITDVMAAPAADKLDALINLNRELAAGLRNNAA